MRGLAGLIGVLGLIFAAGCSAKTATGSETHQSSSCIPPAFRLFGPQPALPKELSTPLEATILSSFAIFRRGALPSEELPGVSPVGGGLDHVLSRDYELSGFYPAYLRQVRRLPDGRRYFVIPAFARPEAVPLARCFRAGVRRRLVQQQHRRLTEPVYCIIEVGGSREAPVPGCEPFAQVAESFQAFHVSDFLGEPTIELVPDGIASVRIVYPSHVQVVASVSENAFLLTPPPTPRSRLDVYLRRLARKIGEGDRLPKAERERITRQYNKAYTGTYPTRIEWLDSAGGLVRAISPPTAESDSATSVGDLRAPIGG
jgi:hypothetical protein